MFGYRFNDDGEWCKIKKDFKSFEEFYSYIEEKHINAAICTIEEMSAADRLGKAYVDTSKKNEVIL